MSEENNDSFSFNLDPYHSFLEPLVGEVVEIYRGGPESNTGKIVDVQSDYVALLVQDDDSDDKNNKNSEKSSNKNSEKSSDKNKNKNKKNNKNNKNSDNNEEEEEGQYIVIYYRTEHLQSIGENTKSNSMPRFQEEEDSKITFKTGTDFLNLVEQFAGEYVQINQGGPESKKGTLLEVSGNYMALLTEDDGVVFFNIHHIKSICESNDNSDEDDDSEEKQIPEYFKAIAFHDLFAKMNYKWVSINRGGPQALEGVLIVNGNSGGHYTLVNNDEVLRINPFHIKSISCGPKGALKSNQTNSSSDDESESSNESSSDNRSSSKSSSKHSSSKKSSSKKSSSKRSSSKKSSNKRSSNKRSSNKRSSNKRSSNKRSSNKRSSSRKSSSKRKSGKRSSHTRRDSGSKR